MRFNLTFWVFAGTCYRQASAQRISSSITTNCGTTTLTQGTATSTITTAAQASAVQPPCGIFTDTIELGYSSERSLNLSMLSAIMGDLRVFPFTSNDTTVDLSGLTSIYGEFYVNMSIATGATFSMNKLAYTHDLDISSWPNPSASDFGHARGTLVLEVVNAEIIETDLQVLNLTVDGGEASAVDNPYLNQITLSGATLGDVAITGNGLQTESNGAKVDMSSVTVAGEMRLNNVYSLAAGKLATAVEMDIENNTLTSLSFPSLTQVQSYIKVNANPHLSDLTLGVFQYIPGLLSVLDNDNLTTFNPFGPGVFGILGQGLTLQGAFETLNLGQIQRFDNSFELNTTKNLDCTLLYSTVSSKLSANTKYSCFSANSSSQHVGGASGQNSTASNNTSTSTNTTTSTPEASSIYPSATVDPGQSRAASGLSTDGKIGVALGASIGTALLLLGLGFLWWRRRNQHESVVEHESQDGGYSKAELDSYGTQVHWGELPADNETREMEGQWTTFPQELSSKTYLAELDQHARYELYATMHAAELEQTAYEMPGDVAWRPFSFRQSKSGQRVTSVASKHNDVTNDESAMTKGGKDKQRSSRSARSTFKKEP